MSKFDFDVSIVGYGPVGSTLAALLAEMGLKVGVFEKNEDVYPKPRAVGFDHDAMRIFQQINCAELLRPALSDFKSTVYLGAGGQIIQKIMTLSPPFPLTWEPHFNCDQPLLESLIRERNTSRINLTTFLDHEIKAVRQSADAVDFSCVNDKDSVIDFRTRYLVGCDGASSFVRKSINTKLESFDYDQHWIVVDMKINVDVLERFPKTNIQFCEPARPSTYIVCPKNHRRWEFMALETDPKDELLSEDFIWSLLKRWLSPHEAKIWRSASYRFHALVADEWLDNRVLICGDAAHQTPPFMGQGMCQGIRDAGNLAWKLSGVIKKEFRPDILKSYTLERRPHVIETTVLAKKLGEILTVRDPAQAAKRDQAMHDQGQGRPIEMVRQNLIPPLRSGIFDFHSTGAGEVFPQPLVQCENGSEVLLDDIEKFKFRVVLKNTSSSMALLDLFSELEVPIILLISNFSDVVQFKNKRLNLIPVIEMNGAVSRFFQTKDLLGVLVRPDHYVYAGYSDLEGAKEVIQSFIKHGVEYQFV